jgi:hypothetical protein
MDGILEPSEPMTPSIMADAGCLVVVIRLEVLTSLNTPLDVYHGLTRHAHLSRNF